MARRVQGTFTVPCYLAAELRAAGGASTSTRTGCRARTAPTTANFNCIDPARRRRRRRRDAPAGRRSTATAARQRRRGDLEPAADRSARRHNFVFCAPTRSASPSDDIPNIASASCQDLGKFPELADRVQQGLLNELYLGRLMIHPRRVRSATPPSTSTTPTLAARR